MELSTCPLERAADTGVPASLNSTTTPQSIFSGQMKKARVVAIYCAKEVPVLATYYKPVHPLHILMNFLEQQCHGPTKT